MVNLKPFFYNIAYNVFSIKNKNEINHYLIWILNFKKLINKQ
jgi:hypothetical protein